MGLVSLQAFKLVAPNLPSSHYKRALRASLYLVRKNQSLAYQLHLKSPGLKRSCSASFNEFLGEETKDLAGKVEAINDNGSVFKKYSSMSFLPSKLEFLEPSLLGIQPNPPEWPERNEIVMRIGIERRANRVEIPLSLRMIKKKQKWQEGNYSFSFCSAKKAFSYMVFMVRELQSHALQIREILYSEDLQGVISKVQVDMNASFVWLFQQVFSRTPTLMVYVMLLLANFTVHSMVGHTHIDIKANPSPTAYEETIPDETIQSAKRGSSVVPREEFQNFNEVDNEMVIWKGMVEEASRMSRFEVLDPETVKRVVSSFKVEVEPDNYEEYDRTNVWYQKAVAEDPYNSLLLSNYAQFLYLVPRDYDRAEECFKRAVMVEPHEAQLLSCYADFLWLVRKDLWGAEERYQQALAAAPTSHYHASKYAAFLWSTGGEDTCFPLSNTSNDNYNKVM